MKRITMLVFALVIMLMSLQGCASGNAEHRGYDRSRCTGTYGSQTVGLYTQSAPAYYDYCR